MAPRWSEDEDGVLRRLYRRGATLGAIGQAVGRSSDAVSERRRTLGIPARSGPRPWSVAEDRLLRAASASGVPATVMADQLGRRVEQVRRRRRELVGGRSAPRAFATAEDEAIVDCWMHGGDVERLARELGRSAGSVRLRARKLGVHDPAPRQRWRLDEDAVVRDGYQRGLTCAEIAGELPGRTETAVAARASKLGLATYARAWTPREDRALRQLARDGVELERAARMLARTPEALRARARKLGIGALSARRAARGRRRWTAGEDDLLRLHGAMNPAALAELLDRSPEAITQRARRIGIREGAARSPHRAVEAVGRGLTPGERSAVARELRTAGVGRRLALARRLEMRPTDLPAMANRVPGRPVG